MGKSTQGDQLKLTPNPPLSDSLAIISAYSQMLEAHKASFYSQLIVWGVVALLHSGRSPEWIQRLRGQSTTQQQEWRAIRQFLPEEAIHALARHLEREMSNFLDQRS